MECFAYGTSPHSWPKQKKQWSDTVDPSCLGLLVMRPKGGWFPNKTNFCHWPPQQAPRLAWRNPMLCEVPTIIPSCCYDSLLLGFVWDGRFDGIANHCTTVASGPLDDWRSSTFTYLHTSSFFNSMISSMARFRSYCSSATVHSFPTVSNKQQKIPLRDLYPLLSSSSLSF